MRKKYLSALLFGALLFASAGTFTSCKDYDDDINNLQSQITANADAITALQNLVGDGKYVTGVSGDGTTITFTFSDESTIPVTVESGEAQVVEVIDGELYIDGEATGIKVAEDAEVETGLVKAENGTWWVLGEDGEYTDTSIPVSGLSVSGSEEEGFVLTIVDADGNETKVEIPTASSLVTSISFGTILNNGELWSDDGVVTNSSSAFYTVDGTKYAAGSIISALNADGTRGVKVNVVVSPTTIDPADLKFSLVNSNGNTIFENAVVSQPTEALTRAMDGVYELHFALKSGLTIDDMKKAIGASDALAVVCGKASTSFEYDYDYTNVAATTGTLAFNTGKYVTLGTEYSVFGEGYNADPTKNPTAAQAAFISDIKNVSSLKLSIDSEVANLYGITFNEDNTAFTISNTAAQEKTITFTVTYADNSATGTDKFKTTTLAVNVASAEVASTVTLSATHVLSTSDQTVFFPLETLVASITSSADKIVWNSGTIAGYYVITDNNVTTTNSFELTSANKHNSNYLTIEQGTEIANITLYKSDKKTVATTLQDAAYIGMDVDPANADVTADTYSAFIQMAVAGKDAQGVSKTLKLNVNFSLVLTNPTSAITRIPLYFDGDNLIAYGNASGTNMTFDVTAAYNGVTSDNVFTVTNKTTEDKWTVNDTQVTIPLDELYDVTQQFEVTYRMFANATNNTVTETLYITGQSPIKDGEITVSKTELSLADGSDTFLSSDVAGKDVFGTSYLLLAKDVYDEDGSSYTSTTKADTRIADISLAVTDANAGAFTIEEIESKDGSSILGWTIKLKEDAGIQSGATVPFQLTIKDAWGVEQTKDITLTITK